MFSLFLADKINISETVVGVRQRSEGKHRRSEEKRKDKNKDKDKSESHLGARNVDDLFLYIVTDVDIIS